MKHFKLLLLWLLLLLTIGSFTNAQFTSNESIHVTWNNQVFFPSSINLPVPINQVTYTLDSWSDWCTILFENSSWNGRCRVYFNVYSNPVYSQCWNYWFDWNININYNASSCSSWWFTINYTVQHENMPVSELTPVITWLWDSINEFIPYVVYVGLGILWALIGFFAIRRLINRVRRQTFWVFKSKRRK